ncbi:MAG: hypothetical protein ACYC6M_09595 [Terriglobales bacterium]
MQFSTRLWLTIASMAWALNFAWEYLQTPLFLGLPPTHHVAWCGAAALADTLVTLLLYFIVAQRRHDPRWPRNLHVADFVLLVLLGTLFGVVSEIVFLRLHLWRYGPAMPRLPLLHVGLLPVLQLSVLPLVTVVLAAAFCEKRRSNPKPVMSL